MPESSGVPEFLNQIGGLLAITCAAGVIWMALMAVIVQRAAERRRRVQSGEPPLPGLHVAAWNWVQRATGAGSAPVARAASREENHAEGGIRSKPPANVPLPDLSMLTGDLAAPIEEPASTPEPEPVAAASQPEAAEPAVPAVPEAPESEAEIPAEADTLAAEPVEVLRVWRDVTSSALIVEIGGQRVRSLVDLREAELEQRFQGVLRDLNGLLQAAPAPPPALKPARPVEIDAPESRPDSFLRQMGRVAMGGRPSVPGEPPAPARTIADEIEDVLQARLQGLPDYADRSIHVKPAPDGSVRIEVDGAVYAGIGEVEADEPAIHALLLDAVREWESQK